MPPRIWDPSWEDEGSGSELPEDPEDLPEDAEPATEDDGAEPEMPENTEDAAETPADGT